MKLQIISLAAVVAVLAGCTSYKERMGYATPISFNQLPAAAQATVRNEIGNRQIARIDQENKYGQPAYRVEVEERGPNPTLWVSSDGSIIKQSSRLTAGRTANEAAGAQSNPNY